MNILVCEDNPLAYRALDSFLKNNGHSTTVVSDGNHAIRIVSERDFDIIIVDIHLPYHSGLELISFLREKLNKKTPVLVISAFSDPHVKKQAFDLGAEAYMTKPLDMKALLGFINTHTAV